MRSLSVFAPRPKPREGASEISSYALDELLGTKMRALYQRKKGRDLFDLAVALETGAVDPARIIAAFSHYMDHGGPCCVAGRIRANIEAKLRDPQFNADIGPLLAAGFHGTASALPAAPALI